MSDRKATMSEELVKLNDQDPHVAVILLRSCIGKRLKFWLRPLPFHGRAQSGGQERTPHSHQHGEVAAQLLFAALLDSSARGGESEVLTDVHEGAWLSYVG